MNAGPERFREELRDVVRNHTVTPREYESLTDEDFASQEALDAWLVEVWNMLYEDEPISS